MGVARVLLKDSAYIQKKDAEYLNKKNAKKDKNAKLIEPIYTEEDAIPMVYPVVYVSGTIEACGGGFQALTGNDTTVTVVP